MIERQTTRPRQRVPRRVNARKVLIVDDDVDFATSLVDVLESRNYVTDVAYDLPAARERLDEFDARVALVDIRLGNHTGIELLEELNRRRPRALVIMMTAYAGTETAIRALQHGAYDYLRKPLDTEELLLTLERCFERLQLEDKKFAAEHALREREQQLLQAQKMESIGRLAGGVAHDLNNLLSPILGYAEMLLLDLHRDDPRHDQIFQIQQAAERARSLTRQLLAFGRKQVLELRQLRLSQVVTGFMEMLRRTIRESIDIRWHGDDSEGLVSCDVSQIEQILMNLALNAQDAMPDGGRLSIEVEDVLLDESTVDRYRGIRPGPHVMLAVSDTGCGMEAGTLAKIFEPFFTTKGKKGTGLGLSTVYGIVQQHGGSIWVYSERGRGTTFKICFPRVFGDSSRKELAPIVDESVLWGNERVLLVEDDEVVRELVRTMLEKHGYQVTAAADADDCNKRLEGSNHDFDLLVTDVVLPETNGREIYEGLRATHPDLRVLYISGYTDDVIDYHGILEPGVKYLQKPFSVKALTDKVREALDEEK